MAASVAQLKGINVRVGGRTILDLDFHIGIKERWLILGPNGSGKSTLLDVLAGRQWPQTGEVRVLGERFGTTDLRMLRRDIALVGTRLHSRLDLRMTVAEAVAGGISDRYASWWLSDHERSDDRIPAMLEAFDLEEIANQSLSTISDGERTRVGMARAVLAKPKLWLLDEPTRALDVRTRERCLRIIRDVVFRVPEALASVLVVHQLEDIPEGVSHVALMQRGRIMYRGRSEEMLQSEPLSDVYEIPLRVEEESGRYSARAR